jgi:transcriptional regulator with XRE-family HTH domain
LACTSFAAIRSLWRFCEREAQAFPTLQYPLPTAAQLQLAFEAEIDLTYMGGIERGKRNPSLLVMARIANAFRAADKAAG